MSTTSDYRTSFEVQYNRTQKYKYIYLIIMTFDYNE